jgi:tetratricopeptide (TPR) repeat protein
MSTFLLLALTALPSAAPPAARPQPLSSRAIYDRAAHGTVYVEVANVGSGTGWVLDAQRRLIVTNYHVASEGACKVFFPIFENGRIVSDPKRYVKKGVRGKVIDSDPKIDLSIVEVEDVPDFMRPLPIAYEPASPGDRLHLVGNPGVSSGLFVYSNGTLRQTTHSKFTFRRGGQAIDLRTLETQLGTNGGDSGSAILNDQGEVVGVNFAGFDGVLTDVTGRQQIVNNYGLGIALEELQLFVKDFNELRTKEAKAGAYERRAARHVRKGKAEPALADLKRAIELDPEQASAYVLRATVNHSRRNYDAVIQDAGTALELNPRDAEAANLRGIAHAARRDFKRAVRDYVLAIRIQPLNATYRTNRGIALADGKNPEAALTDFSEAIRLVPGYAVAYRERGSVHHARRDYRKAIADFETGARLAPNDSLMLHWLADSRLKNSEFTAAAETYVKALKLNDREALMWRGLGDARFAMAQYDLAVEAYGNAVKNAPRDAIAHYRRGRALEQRGDLDEAQDDFAKAIELSPSLERELKSFAGRQVKVANNTAETLKVFVSYEEPGKPATGWMTWTVAAGSTVTLHYDGKPIEARKIRIWAEGARSGKKYDSLKKRDVVLAERPYRARQIDAHVHRFGE